MCVKTLLTACIMKSRKSISDSVLCESENCRHSSGLNLLEAILSFTVGPCCLHYNYCYFLTYASLECLSPMTRARNLPDCTVAWLWSDNWYIEEARAFGKVCIKNQTAFHVRKWSVYVFFCRGLRAYLKKWRGRGFDDDLMRLIAILETSSAQQMEIVVCRD